MCLPAKIPPLPCALVMCCTRACGAACVLCLAVRCVCNMRGRVGTCAGLVGPGRTGAESPRRRRRAGHRGPTVVFEKPVKYGSRYLLNPSDAICAAMCARPRVCSALRPGPRWARYQARERVSV